MYPHQVEELLPLTPLSYHFLLALADGEMHGYGIIKHVEEQTDGKMKPATGALYLAAKRLLEEGLITESEARPDPEFDDQRRKYYRLTELGRAVAVAETKRMLRLVGIAFQKRLVEGALTIEAPSET
ncbi:MAG TPA: helix-turn-helix transcriptional regulator [Gemmatimonadales bacterium]